MIWLVLLHHVSNRVSHNLPTFQLMFLPKIKWAFKLELKCWDPSSTQSVCCDYIETFKHWWMYLKSIYSSVYLYICASIYPSINVLWVFFTMSLVSIPSVFWHCLLSVRKIIRPVKNDCWGAGMLIYLEWGANDLHMVQLMPLPLHHFLLH